MNLSLPPDPDRYSYIRMIAEQKRPWWKRLLAWVALLLKRQQ